MRMALPYNSNFTRLVRGICLVLFFTMGMVHAQVAPEVRSYPDTTDIRIGEQIRFTVEVEADTLAQVIFPEGQTFSPLETVEAFKTDTTYKADRMVLQKIYALTQFDSGVYKLPAQRIEIDGLGFFTDSLRVRVGDVPVDTLKQKMYDIKPLMEADRSYAAFLPWLVFIVFMAAISFALYWFVIRKKPLTEEEIKAQLPPYDRALLELERLEHSKYLIQDEFKKYYSELTQIVRAYLEEEVHIAALESTTSQLLERLELMRDAGELKLEEETLSQFKRILETADLVKFAKSKPATSAAEQDRMTVKNIVIKTKEAIPEPTEDELAQDEEYRREMQMRKQTKKVITAMAATLALLIVMSAGAVGYYGPSKVWDTVSGHPTKELLEGEWIQSAYGFPPITVETPQVLVREEVDLPELIKDSVKTVQAFTYRNPDIVFSVGASATTLKSPTDPNYQIAVDLVLKEFEERGVRNLITKEEAFTTANGIKGAKIYGSGTFPLPNSSREVRGQYAILLFGGKGFQQQLVVTWTEGDEYAEKMVNRILNSLEINLAS